MNRHVRRVVRPGIAAALCVVLGTTSACTGSPRHSATSSEPRSSRSTAGPSSPNASSAAREIALIIDYSGVGIATQYRAPRFFAGTAQARACLAWTDPRLLGGWHVEIHLRIPGAEVASAEHEVDALLNEPGSGTARFKTAPLEAFSDKPAGMGRWQVALAC
ncbi:MAG TPA: hypothetical protein VE442_04630 [Jatrophihabitans sp.]|jgi:hypothetical protein|nr:hypothetical protein [Jatrophihabitans sp.]